MYVDLIIWDDENEPHIVGPGEVTVEDVEEVLHNHPGSHDDPDDHSASTGLPLDLRRHLFRGTDRGRLRGLERRRPDHHPAQDSLPGQGIRKRT
ncbi:MAG TPA: hypothetical protein VJY33_00815 [Isosphaeraceae bacterium]|nr:hypothetical protein [Isosphaeraceae bacterium]